MDKEMFERLDGLHSIDGVKNMLAHFEFVVRDIQKHEPFEAEDIIKFLTIKMESKAARLEL
mgnify:FL=1|jgi:hypothetical protein